MNTVSAKDPKQTTRGAAVTRAKLALADALDLKLSYDREAEELALLGIVLGVEPDEARARLCDATLAELEEWLGKVGEMT